MSLISSPLFCTFNDKQLTNIRPPKVITLPRISHSSRFINKQENLSEISSDKKDLPSNCSVIYGKDPNQIRLPIFGRRSSSISYENEKSSINLDELYLILKEKVRLEMSQIKIQFRRLTNFDSNGKISRQALKHLIGSIFGIQKQISPNQMEKLFEYLHLKHSNKISFDEFLNCLSLNEKKSFSNDQLTLNEQFSNEKTAEQMFLILREKFLEKNESLNEILYKNQFYQYLIKMGYKMKEKEFNKLWNKFDKNGFHEINSEIFLKCLKNPNLFVENPYIPRSESQAQQSSIFNVSFRNSTDDYQFNEKIFQKWINEKLPECLLQIENDFETFDKNSIEKISLKEFFEEFRKFGLLLNENNLKYFLKYLNINLILNNENIDYKIIINILKDKIYLKKKQIEFTNPLIDEDINQISLQKQIENLILKNYDQIIRKIQTFDRFNNGKITKNQMKKLFEDLLEFPIRPDEFNTFLKEFSMDYLGNIFYQNYFQKILQRNHFFKQIQKEDELLLKEKSISNNSNYMISNNIRQSLQQESFTNENHLKPIDFSSNDQEQCRSLEQLNQILRNLLQIRSKDIENEFEKLDYTSSEELTKDILYYLFQRLHIEPSINKKEIVLLWSQFYLKENGKLDWKEFVRQFVYRKDLSHYPNSKENPPKRGDKDYLLTSNKLYGDRILLDETTRYLIKINLKQLEKEFYQLDQNKLSFIQIEDFQKILIKYFPLINQEYLQILISIYQIDQSSKINYIDFLKHFSPNNNQLIQSTREILITKPLHQLSNQNSIEYISIQLRRKLENSYKLLRKAFKQEDLTNSGLISIEKLKNILKEFHFSLNDEQFYILISQLDTKMNGIINYNYFIQKFIKNTSPFI